MKSAKPCSEILDRLDDANSNAAAALAIIDCVRVLCSLERLPEVAEHRNPDLADVRVLLWEIKRLRGLVLRADQLTKVLGNMGRAQGMILDGLRAELEGEPCVAQFPGLDPN